MIRESLQPAPGTLRKAAVGALASAGAAQAFAAVATNITPVSGFTTTSTAGSTTTVTNGYTRGSVAVNVFGNFVVGDAHTVNLTVPVGSTQLVNIVRDSQPQVYGTMNAYQGGTLGGNVLFASSYGFLVGPSGIINVGKLTLETPTQSELESWIGTGTFSQDGLDALSGRTYSVSTGGLVQVQGKINTDDGIDINANRVLLDSGAYLISGYARQASYQTNLSAVNAGDATAPRTLRSDGGVLTIAAAGEGLGAGESAVELDGNAWADGGITVAAASIDVGSTANLDARDGNTSNAAGNITLTAAASESVGQGKASASTSISIAGTLRGNDITATATSKAESNYASDAAVWAATTAIGLVAGVTGNYVEADADATVTVKGTAKLYADNDITLASESHAIAQDPAIALNGNGLIGAAVVYGKVSATSDTTVESGATLDAEGDLEVTAHNEDFLSATSMVLVANNTTDAVVAVSVGESEVSANAVIESGVTLDADNLTVFADNQNSAYVVATAMGLKSQTVGAAISIGNFDTSANAELGSSIGTAGDKVGNVTVAALNRTDKQQVHSSNEVGASIVMTTVGSALAAGLSATQNAINSAVNSLLPSPLGEALAKENDGTVSWRAGAAFSLNLGENDATAFIGANTASAAAPSIVASGNVAAVGRNDLREYRTSASSTVNSPPEGTSGDAGNSATNGVSIAINLAIQDDKTIAEIGDKVSITAANVAVDAAQYQPWVQTYDRWDSLTNVISKLNGTAGLQTNLLTTFANATAAGEENAYGGTFSLLLEDHDTKAWVNDGASITTTGTADWTLGLTMEGNAEVSSLFGGTDPVFSDRSFSWTWDGGVTVAATNDIQTINIAGNAGTFLLLPGGGNNDDGKSIGATVSYVESEATAIAGIGAAKIDAGSGDVDINADSNDMHVLVTPSSGMGEGVGFNGALAVLNIINSTHASLDNGAQVTAGSVNLDALQVLGNWSVGGALAITDEKAVGITAAVNIADTDTQAFIGDNSGDDSAIGFDNAKPAPTTSAPALTAGITTDNLNVRAVNEGTVGAIAVAGAATTRSTDEPGLSDKFSNWYNGLSLGVLNKYSSGVSSASSSSSSGANDAADSDASVEEAPQNGLTGAGSFTLAVGDLDASAYIDGATIQAKTGTTTEANITVQALNQSLQISASGAAAALTGGDTAAQRNDAIAGAIAYQVSDSESQAYINDTTATNTGDVAVQALQGGERVSVGLGIAVNTTSGGSGSTTSGGISLSGAQVEDRASARIVDSSLTARSSGNALEVSAYSSTDIGAGGGSLYYGGKQGLGLAITVGLIADNDNGDATEALVSGSTLTDFDGIDVVARNVNRIALAAAGVGIGTGNDTNGFVGSFSIADVGTSTTAGIAGGTLTGADHVYVNALGSKDSDLETILDNLGDSDIGDDYDFSGASVYTEAEVHTDDSGDGSAIAYGSYGERIINVAGSVQYGKNNIGIAYVHSDVHTSKSATISGGAAVTATDVRVDARDEALIYNVAVGGGVARGQLAGVGSVSVAEINNQVSAEIGDWNGSVQSGSINATDVSVQALSENQIINIAGAITVGLGGASAGGLAAAVSLIGNDDAFTHARIGWTDLNFSDDLTVTAQSGESDDKNLLVTNAIGVGISTTGTLAFAGALSTNNVDQEVQAGVKGIGSNAATATNGSDVVIQAGDYTESDATAWVLAASGGAGAGGIALSVNRVDSDVFADLAGGAAGTLRAGNVSVTAERDNDLLTIDAGVSASKQLALAGSAGVNYTDGHVRASISGNADVEALNNVKVAAAADTFTRVGSGAVGIGVSGGAGALAVSTIVDDSNTEAFIANATVKAQGKNGSMTVNSGDLANSTALTDLSDTDDTAIDRSAITEGFALQDLSEGTQTATGIAVTATSAQRMQNVTLAGSFAQSVAVAADVSTNAFNGETTAYISNSTVNSGVTDATADVLVRASNHNSGLGIAGGVAAAGTGGGMGAVTMNLMDHDTTAKIENSTTKADALTLEANATNVAQGVSAGIGGGATGAGAASVVVTEDTGDTKAWLHGGTTTAAALSVLAENRQESNVATGALGVAGTAGVGFSLNVSLLGGETRALVGDNPDASDATETYVNVGTLEIAADRSESIESYAFGVGIGVSGTGIAGMINVSDTTGETRAGAYDATIRGQSGGSTSATSVTIDAQEIYSAEQHAAGVGGGLTVGVGASFNVVLNRTETVAELVGSDTRATTVALDAISDNDTFITSIAAGGGTFAGAVSLGYVRQGLGDGGDASGELTDSLSSASTALNTDYAGNNGGLSASEQAALDSQSDASVSSANDSTTTSASALQPVTGSSLDMDGSKLTAARISGGSVTADTVTVDTEGRTHAYTVSGAVQGSVAGVSGGLAVTRIYNQNVAMADAAITADTLSVNALETDGAGGSSVEIEAFSAAVGGIAVGVAVSDVAAYNRVVAGATQAVGDGSGTLSVSATDDTSLKVGGDNEDSPENVQAASGSVGVSYSRAKKSADVDAFAGGTGKTISGYTQTNVAADVSGEVRATAFAVSAGLLGGVLGVDVHAEDYSSAEAQIAGNVQAGSGDVNVSSTVVPDTYVRAYGISVAGTASAGGSGAYADVATTSAARIADNTVFSGSGDVNVSATTGSTASGYRSADATALAGSGGILLGIAASVAEATNSSVTEAEVGDYVTLPTYDLNVTAIGTSSQLADADGYFFGAIAVGSNTATAESETATRILFGKDPVGAGSRSGDIILSATGTDTNQAFSTAGGGGAVSGNASESYANAGEKSGYDAVSVQLADWTANKSAVGAGGLQILAAHDTRFFAGASSLAISVIGGSAAISGTDIDVDAKVSIGNNVNFTAQAIDVAATNNVDQILSPADSDFDASAEAGSGGVLNGAAATSTIDVSNMGSHVTLGSNVKLDVFALSAHETLGNILRLEASGNYDIFDEAKMIAGGAFQGGGAVSDVTVVSNNVVTLGNGVSLTNDVDEIQLGSYTQGNAWASANVNVYGAAGVAVGEATTDLTTNNTLAIGNNVTINTLESLNLYAGRSADSITLNALNAYATSDVYNGTAIPLTSSPTADADATVNSSITFGSGVDISTVRNIWLQAEQGDVYADGDGRARDSYDGIFSEETRTGSGQTHGSGTVTFNGTSTIEAGYRYQQSVTIASNGTVTKGTDTVATTQNIASFNTSSELQDYIDALYAEKAALEAAGTSDSDTGGSANDGGSASTGGTSSGTSSNSNAARIAEITEEIAFLEPLVSQLSSTPNAAVFVGGITAAGGDVNITADSIKVTSGTPTITAHGDPTITVTNNSSKTLIIDDLTISDSEGGEILVSGGAANSLPGSLSLVEDSSGTGSAITIDHNPTSTNADVFLQGDVTNLGGLVDINVQQGDLVQTGTVSARQMNIDVVDGIYLLNSTGYQSFGFAPTSLTGYESSARGWKPVSADDLVDWYINARYSSEYASYGSKDAFNTWWYGTDYASQSGTTDTMNVYKNWGFADQNDCVKSSTDCAIFDFNGGAAGAGDRGGDYWGFDKIEDYRSKMTQTASYSQVKAAGYGASSGDALNAQSIFINASYIDINGTIRAGNENNWSVQVGSGFDAAIAQYIAQKGLQAGDTVTLTPGQQLSYQERVEHTVEYWPGMSYTYYTYETRYIDPQVSIPNSGDNGISLSYDVGTGKLTLDDVQANGDGYVALRGKIMSTGTEGKILVDDGLGTIDVINNSTTDLIVGDIDAGTSSTGIIKITDTNYSNQTDWYVHDAGSLIQHYVTGSTATTYVGGSKTTEGSYVDGKATLNYNPKAGQLYYFTEQASVTRSWDTPDDGYWAKYPNTVGAWTYNNQNSPWNLTSYGVTTCAAAGLCNASGSVDNYLTQKIGYGSKTGYTYSYTTSYSPYYGSSFTSKTWTISIPTAMTLNATSYVKADNPIQMQFIGASAGSVDIVSNSDVTLTGNLNNAAGSTSIAANGGSFTMNSSAVISSDSLTLSAAGDLGSVAQALTLTTDSVAATASAGLINIDLSSQSGGDVAAKFLAKGDLTVVSDSGLTPLGTGTQLSGDDIDIVVSSGGIGDVAGNKVFNLSSTGLVTLSATKDIALNQATGDLAVNTITAGGDVKITLGNGDLVNGIGQSSYSDDELAYLATVWDSLNLTGNDAGQEAVQGYENQVTSSYHQLWMLEQRLDDTSDAGFTVDAAYLDSFRLQLKNRLDAAGTPTDLADITDSQVTAYVKTQYQKLTDYFDDEFGAGNWPFDIAGSYDGSYQYTLDPASALYATLTAGAKWTQSSLDIVINSAALEPSTSDYVSSRAANISGNNVTLNIAGGSVGEDLADLNISILRANPTLTAAEKTALLEAGPGDITLADNGTTVTLAIKQQDPIKINADGNVSITAGKEVYVESDQAMALVNLTTTDDIRLTVGGDLTSASGSGTTITGNNLNVGTTQGNLGTSAAPIRLDINGVLLSASASGDIWFNHVGGDLSLGSIGAGGFFSLVNNGNISNWAGNGSTFHILANGVALTAKSGATYYDIGTASRAVALKLTGDDASFIGKNVYVNIDGAGAWSLADSTATQTFSLVTDDNLTLGGDITAASFIADVGGDIGSVSGSSLITTGATTLIGDNVDLGQATLSAQSASLEARAGDLTLAALTTSTGNVSLLASDAIAFTGAVQSGGQLYADGQSISMTGSSSLRSQGAMQLKAIDAAQIDDVTALSTLAVTAASLSATAGSQLSVTGTATVTTTGDQDLAKVVAGSGLTLTSSGGDIAFGDGATITGALQATALAGEVSIAAGKTVSTTSTLSVDATSISMAAGSRLVGAGLDLDTSGAQSLDLLDSTAGVRLDGSTITLNNDVTATGLVDVDATGAVNLGAGQIIDSAAAIDIASDSFTMGTDAKLDAGSSLKVATSGQQALEQLVSGSGTTLSSSGAGIVFGNAVTAGTTLGISAAGAVTVEAGRAVSAGGAITIGSASVTMGSGSALNGGGIAVTTSGGQTLDLLDSTADLTLTSNTGDLALNNDVTVTGNGQLTALSGTVALAAGQGIDGDGTLAVDARSLIMGAGSHLDANGIDLATSQGMSLDLLTSTAGIVLASGSTLALNNDVTAASLVDIDATGAVNLVAGQIVDTAGAIDLTAASLTMGTDAGLDAGSSLAVATSGQQTLEQLVSGASMTLGSSGAGIAFGNTSVAGTTLDIDAAGAVTLAAGESVTAGGTATLDAGSVSMGADASLAATDLAITTSGGQQLELVNANGSLTLDSGSTIALNNDVTAVGLVDIDAIGAVNLTAGQIVDTDSAIDIAAASLLMGTDATLDAGSSLTVATSGQQTLELLVSGTSTTLSSSGAGIAIGNTIVAGSTLDIDAAGAVDLEAGQSVTAGGAVTVDADSVAMGTDSVLNGTAIALTTDGDQVLERVNASGDLDLTSTSGNLFLNDDVSVGGNSALSAMSGTVALAAGQVLASTGNTVIDADRVSMDSDATLTTTDLAISTGGSQQLERVTASGDLALDAGSDIDLNNDVTVSGNSVVTVLSGTVNLAAGQTFATTGNTTVDAGSVIMGSAAQLTTTGLAITTSGNQQLDLVNAGSITLAAGSDLDLNNDVTSTGFVDIDATGAVNLGAGHIVDTAAALDITAASLTMGTDATLDAGSSLSVATSGQQMLEQLVSGTTMTLGSSGAGIAIGNTIVAGSTLDIDAAGAVDLEAGLSVTAGGAVTVDADSVAMGTAAALSGTDVALTTLNGQVLDTITASGNLTLDSGAALTLNNDVSAQGWADIDAVGAVTLLAGQALASSGTMTIDAASVSMGSTAQVNAGSLAITTSGSQNLDLLASTAGIVLDSGSTIALNNDVTAAGLVDIDATGAVTLAAGQVIDTAGAIDVSAASLTMGTDATLDAGSSLTVATSAQQTLEQLVSGTSMTLGSSGAGIAFGNTVSAGTTLDIDAAGAVTLAAGESVTAGGTATLDADSVSMGSGASLAATDLAITTSGDQQLELVTASGDLTLNAGGDIAFNNDVTVQGSVDADVTGDITLAAGQALDAGGNVSLDAASFQMGSASTVTSDGGITVTTSGDQLIASLTSHLDGDNAIVLASGGSITGRDDSSVHLYADGANARTYLSAATGVGSPLVMDLPWLSATTAQGDLNLVSNRDLHAALLSAANGTVRLRTLGDLTVDELVGTPWLWVEGYLVATDMTMPSGMLAARDGMSISNAVLTTEGPLELHAPEMDLHIDGSGNANIVLDVSGFNTPLADDVAITVDNATTVTFSQFQSNYGSLTVPENLVLEYALAPHQLWMQTDAVTLSLDNDNPAGLPVDAQLLTPYGAFSLDLQGTELSTDAVITRYSLPLTVSYQGQDGGSDSSFYRLSTEYQLLDSQREENIVPREFGVRWYERVLNFIGIGWGVDDEESASEAEQPQDNLGKPDDYVIKITLADLPGSYGNAVQ